MLEHSFYQQSGVIIAISFVFLLVEGFFLAVIIKTIKDKKFEIGEVLFKKEQMPLSYYQGILSYIFLMIVFGFWFFKYYAYIFGWGE